MIKYIRENDFSSEVIKDDRVIVVDFFAPWCGPCVKLSSELEELANSRSSLDYDIVKINVDESPNLVRKYGIDSIPVIMIFKNGKLVEKNVGYINRNNIQNLVEKHI